MPHLNSLTAIAALCISTLVAGAAQAGSLDVHLNHLRPGTLRLSVYADAHDWAAQRQPLLTRVVAVRGFSQTVLIDGLKPGRYALRAEQDANWHEMVPALALARSAASGSAGKVGLPSFEQAAVTVEDGDPEVSLRLNNEDRDY